MTEADLYTFLSKSKLAVLASTDDNGKPQSALVGIAVTARFEIIFDTVVSSRKYPNLIARPACSFVIGGWGSREQTVQYEGHAAELRSPDLERYQKTYFRMWPDGPGGSAWTGRVFFVARPTWIRFSDFNRIPPLIHEFPFQADGESREA